MGGVGICGDVAGNGDGGDGDGGSKHIHAGMRYDEEDCVEMDPD